MTVVSGRKAATIRFDARVSPAVLQPGGALTLAFGQRHNPTVLRAVCVSSEELPLAEVLANHAEVADELESDAEAAEADAADLEPMSPEEALEVLEAEGGQFAGLARACREAGATPAAVVSEAMRKRRAVAYLVRFRLEPEPRP